VPISFELENETTAGEVYDAIVAWLTSAGHRLEAVRLNREPISDLDGPWRTTSVTEVNDLDITAISFREKQVNDFETIIHYLELLQRVLREGTEEQRSAVLEELPHVERGIAANAPDLAGLLSDPLTDADLTDEAIRQTAIRRAGELASLVERRERELLDPEHEMGATLSALDSILPAFEELPGEIQGGDRRKALEIVARFSELVSRELRILPILMELRPELRSETVDGSTIHESIPALNDLFRELEGAFTNEDYVLVGDLLEYEMLPRFTALHQALRLHLGDTAHGAGGSGGAGGSDTGD
jgi:hypothetical protein